MSITKELIGQSYEDVKTFNSIAGNLKGDYEKQVDNQLGYIFEELTEAIAGMENKDGKELLDGACDVLVTTFGLLQKLEAAGFDVATAIKRVDANNLSKFPVKGDALQYDAAFTATLNEEFGRYVIKDAGGKVRKPATFVPVDLSDLVAKDFFKAE